MDDEVEFIFVDAIFVACGLKFFGDIIFIVLVNKSDYFVNFCVVVYCFLFIVGYCVCFVEEIVVYFFARDVFAFDVEFVFVVARARRRAFVVFVDVDIVDVCVCDFFCVVVIVLLCVLILCLSVVLDVFAFYR